MKQEIWTPVKEYENYYHVSNIGGKVKSLAKTWSVGKKGDTILKFGKRKHKKMLYYFVVLCVNKIKRYVSVHRLVAQHYVDNPNNYDVVNHLDSNTLNNDADNLEWTTTQGNVIHSFSHGNRVAMRGERHGGSKLKENDIIEIKKMLNTGGLTHKEIAEMYGVGRTVVTRISSGTRWKHI